MNLEDKLKSIAESIPGTVHMKLNNAYIKRVVADPEDLRTNAPDGYDVSITVRKRGHETRYVFGYTTLHLWELGGEDVNVMGHP